MLKESGLRVLSDILIGDVQGYYTYKSGSQIVKFFNENFEFTDKYGPGFPSRWAYALESFKRIFNVGQFDKLLNFMLSKQFIMRDLKITEIEALEQISKTVEYINNELSVEGYKVIKRGNIYTLIEENSDLVFVGEGGFANVYKSKSTGLIVKKLKDDFKTHVGIRSRFKREFEITKSLSDHDGIITVYDFNASDYSYTMEEAESTLEEFVMKFEHLETSKITMIRQVLHIIKLVHERGIIHRDISPNNILLFGGRLKISDFGLGKDLDMFHSHRTMRTASLGQYYYCAPEQFMQLRDGDKRSDVYSLGSLINFILSGDPRDARHFLRNPVEKAKNENPSMRYEDAGALLKGIEQAIKFHLDKSNEEAVKARIASKIFDSDVESYIYSLNDVTLCKAITSMEGMVSAVLSFISIDDKRAIDVLTMIKSEYQNVCSNWTDYDDIGRIAYNVIFNDRTYVAQEIAADILNDVAYGVNRFNMQKLVDELIGRGIDPTIEERLKG